MHKPLDDPLGAQQGRGISHEIGVVKMLKQVQEELDAITSSSIVFDLAREGIVLLTVEAADNDYAEELADAGAPAPWADGSASATTVWHVSVCAGCLQTWCGGDAVASPYAAVVVLCIHIEYSTLECLGMM
jgi:hypothetical protein